MKFEPTHRKGSEENQVGMTEQLLMKQIGSNFFMSFCLIYPPTIYQQIIVKKKNTAPGESIILLKECYNYEKIQEETCWIC